MLNINEKNVNYSGVRFAIKVCGSEFRELYDYNDAVSFARYLILYGIYEKQDVTINVTLTEILHNGKSDDKFDFKYHVLCVIKFD